MKIHKTQKKSFITLGPAVANPIKPFTAVSYE
jgi:hypothetical protein